MKTTFLLLASALVVFAVSRCGKNVCVAGLGQCEEMFNGPSATPGTGVSTQTGTVTGVYANAENPKLGTTGSTGIVITGGVSPYTCKADLADVADAKMTTTGGNNCTVTGKGKTGVSIVTVTDSKSNSAQVLISFGTVVFQ